MWLQQIKIIKLPKILVLQIINLKYGDVDSFAIGEAATADAGNVAFYPAAGYRHGTDGHINYIGWACIVWAASPYSATSQNAGYWDTSSNWVRSVNDTNRSSAFPVRCVQD